MDPKTEKNIEVAYLRNWETVLVGDVNVDYLDRKAYSKHRLMKSLKNMTMTQHVTVVTRPKSNSCLDHATQHMGILSPTYLYHVLDFPIISQFFYVATMLS